jgi:hypothetical protein
VAAPRGKPRKLTIGAGSICFQCFSAWFDIRATSKMLGGEGVPANEGLRGSHPAGASGKLAHFACAMG